MANRKPMNIACDQPPSKYDALIESSGSSAKQLVRIGSVSAMTPTMSFSVR